MDWTTRVRPMAKLSVATKTQGVISMRATFSARYEQRTDAQLIQAFYLGEENALSLLADRLWRPLTQFALSRLPSTEVGRYQLAEDLVQETIIKVAQTKHRSKARWQNGKSSVFTWMGAILKNIIHSHLRTKKNRIRVTSDLISSTESEADYSVEQNIVDYRFSQKTEYCEEDNWLRALSQLPEELNQCVKMQLEGKSHREIASELGLSRSTVTYRIKNATHRLRGMLAA